MALTIITILHILALLLLLVEIIYIVLQKPSQQQIYLLFVTCGTFIMLVGCQAEITASSYDAAFLACCFSYVGKPFTLLGTTAFIVTYAGYRLPKKLTAFMAIYGAFFTLVVFTNEYHHLYYADSWLDKETPLCGISILHGPLYWLYTATLITCTIINMIAAIKTYRKATDRDERLRGICMFSLVFVVIIGYIIYLSGISGGYDTTMPGCIAGAVVLFILFTKFRLFDVIDIAKNQALDDTHNGLLVLNRSNSHEYSNKIMDGLLSSDFSLKEFIDFPEGETKLTKGITVYSVRKNIIKRKERGIGWVIETVDITDSHNYSLKLEHEIAERISELQHVQRKVIAGFTNIVEARDGSTGDHIKNTIKYVTLITEGLRKKGHYENILTDMYIQRLIDASPLHDIGKISIPDNVLLKPARLTDEEFEIIKTHTTLGENIIEKTMRGIESDDYVRMAKDVVLYHHEKWNGTGYPKGLKGDEIPLSARIMAVADVYDALISERCYKSAIPPAEACEIIKNSIGTHFDPLVAEAFLDNIN